MLNGPWIIYLCRECGWIQGEEEQDLACSRCGADRSSVEQVEVVRADWAEMRVRGRPE